MKLFQEYSRRHNIKCPYVHHGNGFCVIRNYDGKKNTSRWLFVDVNWSTEDVNPGMFTFKILYPLRDSGYKSINSYNLPNYFTPNLVLNWKWSEHNENMLSWVKNLQYQNSSNLELITDKNLAYLNAWEVFVFMHDSWLVGQNHEIKNLIFESLNKDSSNDYRMSICKDLCAIFTKQNPKLMYNWTEAVLKYYFNYSDWLVDLIKYPED